MVVLYYSSIASFLPRIDDLFGEYVHLPRFAVFAVGSHADGLAVDQAGDDLGEFAFAHVAGIHELGVLRLAAEFVEQGFDHLSLPGELVLFLHQLEQGVHVFHVEAAERPGHRGDLVVDGARGDELSVGAAGLRLAPIRLRDEGKGDEGAELEEIAVEDAREIAHQGVVGAAEILLVFLPV